MSRPATPRPVRAAIAALLFAPLLIPHAASAHAVAGPRIFVPTLTMDDPGVADEAALPTITYTRIGVADGGGPTHEFDFAVDYSKRITPKLGVAVDYGWDLFSIRHAKTQTGFENLSITGKYQVLVLPEHEFMLSVGITREFGRTGTQHTGADSYGATAPTLYVGKGLGDLDIGLLRPLAITGELSYAIADRKLKFDADGNDNQGAANAWAGGISVQYSLDYLHAQVRDIGLPGFFNRLTPLVEFTWSSPASRPHQSATQYMAAPGVIWVGNSIGVGIAALIPLNRAAGRNVGVIGQLHFFLDDLFPNTIGKPLFQ